MKWKFSGSNSKEDVIKIEGEKKKLVQNCAHFHIWEQLEDNTGAWQKQNK